jgi:hypothetical protein
MEKNRIRDKHPGSATLVTSSGSGTDPGPDPSINRKKIKINLDFQVGTVGTVL